MVQPSENVKMAIGEIYDAKSIARDFQSVQLEKLQTVLRAAGPKDVLKKVINTNFGKFGAVAFYTARSITGTFSKLL